MSYDNFQQTFPDELAINQFKVSDNRIVTSSQRYLFSSLRNKSMNIRNRVYLFREMYYMPYNGVWVCQSRGGVLLMWDFKVKFGLFGYHFCYLFTHKSLYDKSVLNFEWKAKSEKIFLSLSVEEISEIVCGRFYEDFSKWRNTMKTRSALSLKSI